MINDAIFNFLMFFNDKEKNYLSDLTKTLLEVKSITGEVHQRGIVVEELTELSLEVQKIHRNKTNESEISSEMADVFIGLFNLFILKKGNPEIFFEQLESKLARLKWRIENDRESL